MRSKYEKHEMLLAWQQLGGTNKPGKIHDSVKNTGPFITEKHK